MRGVSLSGWGQAADVLQEIWPGVASVDYAKTPHVAHALGLIPAGDMVIGWSLGGQLAVRAVAAGLIRPKKLVLIATPFQFVATDALKLGMPAAMFRVFRDNYAANPQQTLNRAWASILKGDSKASDVRAHLERQDREALLDKHWLAWLEHLQEFSCADMYMGDFPPTLLIHGREDAVVYHAQSLAFAAAIPQSKLVTFESCGHAPHWHDPQRVAHEIKEFADG